MNKNLQNKTLPRAGELLVKEGFISKEQLKKALIVQKQELKEAKMPFDQLLVKKGFLAGDKVEIIKGHPDLRRQIGEMIVDLDMVSTSQIDQSIKEMKRHEHLGQVLVKKKLISKDDLDEILEQQKDALDFGELAVRLQMISEIDLVRALSLKNSRRTVGEILCDMEAIRPEDLNYVLKRHKKQLKLGEILIKQGAIDEKQFQTAIREQVHTNEKLGKVLIRKNFLTGEQLYNALSRQYNIPYKELDNFYYDENFKKQLRKFVGEMYARRNLIVPLQLDGSKLLLGMTNPEGFNAVTELKVTNRELEMSP